MPPVKRSLQVTKRRVVDLLNNEAGMAQDNLACAAESTAVLGCWATYIVREEQQRDPRLCQAEELALKRCEMLMGQKGAARLKKDMKKSLIFHVLRLSNYTTRRKL